MGRKESNQTNKSIHVGIRITSLSYLRVDLDQTYTESKSTLQFGNSNYFDALIYIMDDSNLIVYKGLRGSIFNMRLRGCWLDLQSTRGTVL